MTAETYLRRGRRRMRTLLEKPGIRETVWALSYGLAGFLLAGASILKSFQPIAAAMAGALRGWQAMAMGLGAMAGYRFFWGRAGIQGVLWSGTLCLLSLMLGRQKKRRPDPLLGAMVTGASVAGAGLLCQVVLKQHGAFSLYCLRILVAGLMGALGTEVFWHRDSLTDWLAGGVITLSLSQIMILPYLGLGYVAGSFFASGGAFPAAVLAGLGLDLAQVTALPMTAVLCGAYLLRMIPFSRRWIPCFAPAAAYVMTSLLCGIYDPMPLPGLILGGGLALLRTRRPRTLFRRGPTGLVQVQLEISAGVMNSLQRIFLTQSEPAIDREALLKKAQLRACSRCPSRQDCQVKDQLSTEVLKNPLEVTCRKTGRLVRELQRSAEQLKIMKLEKCRRQEFRVALIQQYGFLSRYLQELSDQLLRRDREGDPSFCVQVSARSHRKESANGDCCLAFPGTGCLYYVVLCDGMGTGLGAAEEGKNAGRLIRQMLRSGLSPKYVLQNINSILVLRGQAGAVTVDLAELHLDSGKAWLYKWGAAPSFLIKAGRAEKIGTATPPPGISLLETREAVKQLSLSRGEVLILLSDGIDGEEALHHMQWGLEATTGEMAEGLLQGGCRDGDDDATAAVLRLRPASLVT